MDESFDESSISLFCKITFKKVLIPHAMAGVGAGPTASGAGASGHIKILRETIPDDDAEAAKVGGSCA